MDILRFKEKGPYLACIVIGLLAFLLYANSLGNGFVFDDMAVLEQNEFVQQGISGIPTIFTTGSWDGVDANANMHIYRPIQLTVLAVQFEIFGLKPFGYHLVHVLTYALLCMLVFWLLLRLFKEIPFGNWLAFLSAVLFAAHPIHTEVVANIKGNGDLIAMLLGVVSLHFLWQYVEKENKQNLLLMSIMFLLALMTKETIVCLIGIAYLMLFFFSSFSLKKTLLTPLPLLVPIGIYLLVRSLVFGENAQELTGTSSLENVVLMADGISEEIGIRLYALGKNLKLLAYPYPLVFMYVYNSIPMVGFWDIRALLPLLVYSLLAFCFLRNFKKNNIWGFSIGFYFVAIALFSNTVVGIPNIISERWLLLPSLAFCIALAHFLIILFNNQRGVSIFLTAMILFGYSGYTIQRNLAWKSNLTLAETDIKVAPENVIINGVLANMLLGESSNRGGDQELLKRSAYHYEKALGMNPSDYVRMNNLGLVYEQLGEYEKAAGAFQKARGYESDIQSKAHFSEAKNWYLAEEYNRALTTFMEIEELYPNIPEVSLYLASVYGYLDQDEKAAQYSDRAIRLIENFGRDKDSPDAMLNHEAIANMLLAEAKKLGDDPDLLRRCAYHYEAALKLKPDDWNGANNLGIIYEQIGEYEKAAMTFSRVKSFDSPLKGKASFSEAKNWYLSNNFGRALESWIQVDQQYPNVPDVAYYLAKTYEGLGRTTEAVSYYRRVLELTENLNVSPTDASIVPQSKAKLAELK